VREELKVEVLNEDESNTISTWNKQIERIVVATMEPDILMETVTNSQSKILIITSSDRSDILLAALALYHSKTTNLVGVLLSEGIPPKSIMNVISKTGLPVLMAEQGVYTLASLVHDFRHNY